MRGEDATLVEVDPLILDERDVITLDGKVTLDGTPVPPPTTHSSRTRPRPDPLEAEAASTSTTWSSTAEFGIIGDGTASWMSTLDVVAQ